MKLTLILVTGILVAAVAALALRFDSAPRVESRLPLHFDHGFHMGVPCNTCHHNFARTEARFAQLSNQRCIACHLTLADQEPIIEATFHDFCKGCHLREKLAGNPAGPVRQCSTCHVRTPSTDLIVGRQRFGNASSP